MSRVLVPLAAGFEEMEAVAIIDVLRRAAVEVVVAGLHGQGSVEGAHGIVLQADVGLADLLADDFDMMVLPGGEPGTTNLAASPQVQSFLQYFAKSGKPLAAICAAPRVLAAHGLLDHTEATSHPSVEAALRGAGAIYQTDRVVRCGNVVTSRGPGTALEFALEILRLLGEEAAAERLQEAMLVQSQ